MLKMRLQRVGRRNAPSFRVVVVDARQGPKSSKTVETIGFYNPKTKERSIDTDRASYWLGVGVQPSGTVYNMLIDENIIEGKKKNVLPHKSPVVKEEDTEDTTEQVEGSEKANENETEEAEEVQEEEASKDEAEEVQEEEDTQSADGETSEEKEEDKQSADTEAPADAETAEEDQK